MITNILFSTIHYEFIIITNVDLFYLTIHLFIFFFFAKSITKLNSWSMNLIEYF